MSLKYLCAFTERSVESRASVLDIAWRSVVWLLQGASKTTLKASTNRLPPPNHLHSLHHCHTHLHPRPAGPPRPLRSLTRLRPHTRHIVTLSHKQITNPPDRPSWWRSSATSTSSQPSPSLAVVCLVSTSALWAPCESRLQWLSFSLHY